MDLLDEDSKTKSVHVEGKGEDIEDVTITMTDGTEEVIETKKRETGGSKRWEFGGYLTLSLSSRPCSKLRIPAGLLTVYRFVSNANAH